MDINKRPIQIFNRDHIQGSQEASIVLIEYGDYESIVCGKAHRVIQSILQQLCQFALDQTQLCFVFRHFPQATHLHAQRAAEAAEAAAVQGQFWQMHNMLFEHQCALGNSDLVEYAYQLGLDIPQFLRDLSNGIYVDRIHQDLESGRLNGVSQPPTLFINGAWYQQGWTVESLSNAILQASMSTR